MTNDPASMRNASRARSLGSAKSGATDAWRMHVTAVALVPLSIGFVCILLSLIGKNYAGARAELGHPFPALILLLFILAGVWHMKIGMQSIIDDYLHSAHLKSWALLANLFFSIGVGLACVFATLKLSLS
jgi:succinate dehydrogenase / fumarate reductase, membrane anchor subunit